MSRKTMMRFLTSYMLAALAMLVLINTYGVSKLEERIIGQKKEVLYKEAELLVSEYVTSYYESGMKLIDRRNMNLQLQVMGTFLDARIWVIDSDGDIISDTDGTATKKNILKYYEGFTEHTFIEGVYIDEIFPEPMLCVILPVNYDFSIKGYLCISTSMSDITSQSVFYLDIFNLCFLIFLVILALLLVYIYYVTVRPVRIMTDNAKSYARGKFTERNRLNTSDEYQELSDAIEYMADELQNLDEYQKKFVANISHDFRSPLTSIRGYAEAMQDGTIPYEMQGKYLDIILFETERLTKLTSNLLTLNSFEQNGIMLDIRTFDINAVIKRTAETFEGVCVKKKVAFRLEFSEKETFVEADLDKIQQVLYNLIDNAVKFSNPDSHVRITTDEKGNKVVIGIKDYGIGIPKDSLNKIWERFYKTDLSRGKDKKGTGLGLSITREIIEAHNENISVVSTEGSGTEFIFTLEKSAG